MPGHDTALDWAVAKELADAFRALAPGDGVEVTAERACGLAVKCLPGCDHAGLSLVGRSGLKTVGASAELPVSVDQLQGRLGQGPGIDATGPGGPPVVSSGDLGSDPRWPELATVVADRLGVGSVLVFRLEGLGQMVGALTLLSFRREAFDPALVGFGELFSTYTAMTISSSLSVAHLRAALETRETISVAMGLLMGRQNVSREQAFEILRRASQRENVKLREVASRLVGSESFLS